MRELYGDRLFTRASQGLVPTAVAERLYEQLGVALTAIESTLHEQQSFDSLTSTRRSPHRALRHRVSVLPGLVEGSDLLVILPSRTAALYASQRRLKVLELPVPIPEFEVRMHWQPRHETSLVQRWLRGEVLQVLSRL